MNSAFGTLLKVHYDPYPNLIIVFNVPKKTMKKTYLNPTYLQHYSPVPIIQGRYKRTQIAALNPYPGGAGIHESAGVEEVVLL